MRWFLTFLIGFLTAAIAFGIIKGTDYFATAKFDAVQKIIDRSPRETAAALFAYAGISSGYVLVATLLVAYVEPVARGSGIPEIKATLNGINLPRCVRVKTLLVKATGVLGSVAGGLPVGKEGPMIHSGAVTGAGVSQGKSTTLGFDTAFTKFSDFRNEREKRDFIACGAAAGVAAAFGAPIGGVLFSLEEGATHWSLDLTWRSFFCAMTTVFWLDLFQGQLSLDRRLGVQGSGMLQFGSFNDDRAGYVWYELLLFILMGLVGGLMGAVFNGLNVAIMKCRKRYLATPARAASEAVFVALVIALISFSASRLGTCEPIPKKDQTAGAAERGYMGKAFLKRFYCKEDEYNPLATLFFTPAEHAIKQLFHFQTVPRNASASVGGREYDCSQYPVPEDDFSLSTLALFFTVYFFLACWTYGLAVPSGLFVPSLLAGAAYGRGVGLVLQQHNVLCKPIDAGIYSLIGASAVLGGMARMTISLTAGQDFAEHFHTLGLRVGHRPSQTLSYEDQISVPLY